MDWITQSFWILGAITVSAFALMTLWMVIETLSRNAGLRAQRMREAQLLDARIATVRKSQDESKSEGPAWIGWRKFEVKQKVFEDKSKTQASFYLCPHDRKPFPSFRPGQFLTFQLEVPDETKPVVRCYSMSDCYCEDHYRVTIKRAPDPARASGYFLDQVEEGSVLDVRAPAGPFFLNTAHKDPVVLIGSGIGITPVLAMLNAILKEDGQRETWFFYGVRNSEEAIFLDWLHEASRTHPNIHLHVLFSRPGEQDVEGKDFDRAGRVNVDLFKELLPSNNYDFFLCGPTAMMDDIKAGLAAWDVPKERVHYEDFSPPREAAKLDDATSTGPPITFKKSGKTVNWNTQAKNILEFALANEIEIEAGCWLGNCGTCKRAILKGEFDYEHDPDFECEAGSCLTCCARPKGPMEIDA